MIRAERWSEAEQAARTYADPVALKLVSYYRLLAPNAARASEIAGFLAENPDWPNPALLGRRLQEALATEPDDAVALALCAEASPVLPGTLLRCADAAARSGKPGPGAAYAKQAWIAGIDDQAAELTFMRVWGPTLSTDDQWRRFGRLAWNDKGLPGGSAARQVARLDGAHRSLAEARLALKRSDPNAAALLATLPQAVRDASDLMLEQARWLRRAGQDGAALELWKTSGADAERKADRNHQPAFWNERNLLARRLLRSDDATAAYALASQHQQSGTGEIADAEFLAGWIALRRLSKPDDAIRHFQTLAAASKSAITQGRAHYWLARAATAKGDDAHARAEYAQAAEWGTTYYGQLAARALGETGAALATRLKRLRDPAWDEPRALAFAGREVARAAALLVSWNEHRRARAFLSRLDAIAPDLADRALAARFAEALGLPDQAVSIARRAGRDGLMLPEVGWPVAVKPPGPPEQAVSLAIIRQESNFDVGIKSPVGARGLMQLMPATAKAVARRIGEPVSLPALTTDGDYNMRLGTAYLQGLLDQFGDALPLAAAGYNAGPSRVRDWMSTNGDPLSGQVDMVDWIELIPFNETRNYVQRVIENVMMYRARRGELGEHPLARWLG